MSDQWYLGRHTPTGEQKSGPMTFDQLKQMAAAGQLVATDLLYREGMANWAPASSIPELAGSFRAGPGPAAPSPAYAGAPYGGPGYGYPPPPPQKSPWPMILIGLAVAGGLGMMCIIVCLAAITTVGQNANTTFSKVGSQLAAGTTSPAPGIGNRQFTRDDFQNLVRGEKKDDVRRLLGIPDAYDSEGGGVNNVWIYRTRITDGVPARIRFDDDDEVANVTFRN